MHKGLGVWRARTLTDEVCASSRPHKVWIRSAIHSASLGEPQFPKSSSLMRLCDMLCWEPWWRSGGGC